MRRFHVVSWVLAAAAALAAPAAQRPGKGSEAQPEGRWTAKTFAGLELRNLGPALMSGRIADVAVHPADRGTWYVAAGSGGVWKTTNAGTTWTPIFDGESSYSIGCVAIDPRAPDTIWVGTGENVSGRHVGFGDGVYRSRDGGKSWIHLGLRESEHLARIRIDPRDSNVVFVAAEGPLWSAGGERGLFKTTDGGATWRKVLGGGEHTGATDVLFDPRDPDVLYAATHQRLRSVAALIDGGPESGIHKSTDGGETWRRLERGLPEEALGKIGLAASPLLPGVVYATIELAHRKGGFWRSADGGESWDKRSDRVAGGTGPHYYQEIFASPHAADRVYLMDVRLRVTEDGGKTWRSIETREKHVDNHALAFDPLDPEYLLAGCDGGLYESWDLGETWKFVANLPLTQFYKIAVDYDEPFYNVYGGTQDNSTQGGPSRTDNVHGIRNSDWFLTLFADGHQPAVDPTNPDVVYSQWQQGNLVRHDRRTGEIVYIQPQPGPGEPWERFNWDAPILISPHDPARLWVASQRVWRSDDRGDAWTPASGDLTRALDRLALPLMGRVWSFDAVWDLYAMSKYGTITSLAESPLVPGLLYAGTDDGRIAVTEDGGKAWRTIERLPGVPDFYYVNDLKADLHRPDTVYAAVDDHKTGDYAPYLLRSDDRGRSWRTIVGDLPERHLVWRLVQDHVRPELLFAGTEFGVFFTIDGGKRWIELTGDVPTIPFRDLAIQRRENDLVCGSFGRGIFVLDDYTPLRALTAESLEREAELFPVRQAWWYVERRPLGGSEKAFQGAAFFTAPNPPFGAVFTYWLRDELRGRKDARREREKAIEKEGGDTPYPGWDALREEELERDPAILLTVRDAEDRVVRRVTGPVEAGFHRVAWDLRHPSPVAWKADRDEDERERERDRGFLAPPGTYTVALSKRIDGVETPLGKPRTFEVVPLRRGTLTAAPKARRDAFLRELNALLGEVNGAVAAVAEQLERVEAILEVLDRAAVAPSLHAGALAIERELRGLEQRLRGNERRGAAGDPGPPSIERRLDVAVLGNRYSTYGPTPTHEASADIAREELRDARERLERLVRFELPELERRLDEAGVAWTPGRLP